LLKSREVAADEELERVFEGKIDNSSNVAPTTNTQTTEEEWWPF